MKKPYLVLMLLLMASITLHIGCSKDSDMQEEVVRTPDLEFNIEGQGVRKFDNSIIYDLADVIQINGTGSYNKPYDIWAITLTGPAETGTFDISNISGQAPHFNAVIQDGPFCWDPFNPCPLVNRYIGNSGTITITQLDTEKVKGTFNFIAVHNNGTEKIVHSGWFDITK